MSEPTPSYYPAGWDRERVLNISAAGEAGNWTQEEADTFCEGLRADLGQMGFEQFWDEVETREKVARGSPIVPEEPPFMEFMRECREKRGWTWDRWGFVVYKSPEIVDAAQWTACKERFMQILHDQAYQDEYRMHPGFDECLSKMTFQWMEDVKEGAGDIASIAEIYSSSSPPAGLDHEMCLYITPSSLHSILNTALPSTSKRRYRIDIPFVVAIFAHHVIQHKTLTTKHEDKKDDKERRRRRRRLKVKIGAASSTLPWRLCSPISLHYFWTTK
ncbi:hypothetical protein B0T22DRAFT_489 [Podospora appendiculata]|uniref:Uncharacterized protein n=1 Tax=Podospora appendiculata TaxID=314037 RepID=A0AAE0XF16_9PEZI|nr:hypothetical protein B0T22DRAFT_489 [Podospora appendiculata]